jgi:2-polyprenyl-3-methyl-5-hydroxy-6-metoxy-1,4-benzoquinol methylase
MLSQSYTLRDHEIREHDRYALAKYRLTLRWASRFMQPGQTVFNVGCGNGYFNRLAAARGWRVFSCEPDPDAYALAADTVSDVCSVENCGLDEFASKHQGADLLVMHDVLEHIEDDRTAAERARALLKPGGRAIVSVPAMPSLYGRHDEMLGHYRRYTKGTFRSIVDGVFVTERLRYFAMFAMPIVWYFSVHRRADYPASGASAGLAGSIFGTLCDLETFVSPPLGTSLIALLRAPEN